MMEFSFNTGNSGCNFLSRIPVVTKNILIINVFMMIFTRLNQDFMYETFSLFYPASPFFRWWQPVTHLFMHGGWDHLFFNMFTFLMFGCTLERQWGPKKYLLFYLVTGLGAAALHILVMHFQIQHFTANISDGGLAAIGAAAEIKSIYMTPMVGASGAIYGILMGFAMLFPDTVMFLLFPPIPLKAKWWIIIFLVIELLTGYFNIGGGIAHFAHLGGMLFAWALIKYWKRKGTMYRYEQ